MGQGIPHEVNWAAVLGGSKNLETVALMPS
jgi:hypothetical protein